MRLVVGRDVIYPPSNLPHIRMANHPDGTLLKKNCDTESVLAVDPTWLTEDTDPAHFICGPVGR